MTYQQELEQWLKRKPPNGSNYDYEQWLEEKPAPGVNADGTPRKPAATGRAEAELKRRLGWMRK